MGLDFSSAQGNKLLNTAAKKTDNMNSEHIVSIPVDEIVPNPDNDKIFSMKGIEGLAKTIKEDGFTGAVEVTKLSNGKYELLSGHRRLEATKMAGNTTIPAVILPNMDEASKAKKLLTSNIYNREMTAMDKAKAIEYYIQKVLKSDPQYKGNTQEDAAKFFNIGVTQVKYLRRLLKFIPEIQELVDKEYITYVSLIDAAKFTDEQQMQLYNDLMTIINGEMEARDKNPETKGTPFSTLQNSRVAKVIESIKYIQRAKEEKELLEANKGSRVNETAIIDSSNTYEQKSSKMPEAAENPVIKQYAVEPQKEVDMGIAMDEPEIIPEPKKTMLDSDQKKAGYSKEAEAVLLNTLKSLELISEADISEIPNIGNILSKLEYQINILKHQI